MANTVHQSGFTLQELMISVAVFFIVSAIGIPGYISYVHNATRDNTVTDLYSNMYYARSEALKLNATVTLCRTADINATAPACGGTANDWTTGWLVFVDNNNNGLFDNGEKLLKLGKPPGNGIQVMANAAANASISYLNDGSLKPINAPATFAICDDRNNDKQYNATDAAYGRDITIGIMGRPQVTGGSNGISTCTP